MLKKTFEQLGTYKEEREHKKRIREVNLAADAVVDYIENRPRSDRPYRFNIGKPPKGLSKENFIAHVGQLAMDKLNTDGEKFDFNFEESLAATDEFDVVKADQPVPKEQIGARVVLHKTVSIA